MAKTSNLDQGLKQKVPSSSLIASDCGIPDPVTTSANGGRLPKSHEMPKECPQKTNKAQQSHQQASGSYQAPMLRRWLEGDNPKKASQFGGRDGYPKGGAGMSQYLNDWDRAWQRTGNEPNGNEASGNQANGKDLGKDSSKDF